MDQLEVGELGGVLVTGTGANTGNYGCLVPLEDITFTSITINVTGTFTGVTFPKGVPIFGIITAFQLASGKVIAYNR